MNNNAEAKMASDQMYFSGWNSDLESSFLDRSGNPDSWDETLNEWTELTTFRHSETTPNAEAIAKAADLDAKDQGSKPSKPAERGTAEMESLSLPSSTTKDGVVSVTESSDRSSEAKQSETADPIAPTRLHPQAIQSSAMCPPHGKILPQNYEHIFSVPSQQMNRAANLYGVNLGRVAAAASNAVSNTPASVSIQNALQGSSSSVASSTYQSQSISSLANNFRLAHSGTPSSGQALPTAKAKSTSSQQQRQKRKKSAPRYITSSGNSGSSSASSSQPTHRAPPFLLFDSPVELRANFNQNQRRLGMPVKHDCNSYHYGEAVKGFHPQHIAAEDGGSMIPQHQQRRPEVQLIDGRHGPPANVGRAKNEREQKRAQKITELIDQLGVIMNEGGWKIGKSKYQTLSSCTEYVEHLVKIKEEKESAVKKLKKEVEEKKRRMEEDKTSQGGRSDPESVTSSLTSSTNGSSHKKARLVPPRKMGSHDMFSFSTNEDSSGEDRTNGGPTTHTFSIDKTVSSASDLTDSNRGSSSNNSGSAGSGSGSRSGSGSTEREQASKELPSKEAEASTSSISSDAAVASEKSSRDRHSGSESPQHDHKDVVFSTKHRKDRKRPLDSSSSLERSFKLDYEEVFDQSNIPQLIAGTSGKIVSWNQSFVNATGLAESHLERMTIFSLVQPNKLSNFFEIAARALRSNDDEAELTDQESSTNDKPPEASTAPNDTNGDENMSKEDPSTKRKWNYAAMTLPCIEFPAMKERRGSSNKWEYTDNMNVTMILITDPDPRKRCFHCTFTDCPGTDGSLGIVTPDLLAALYSDPERPNLKQHTHNRRKHKRARLQEGNEQSTTRFQQTGHQKRATQP